MVINPMVWFYIAIIGLSYWRWDDHPQYRKFRHQHIYSTRHIHDPWMVGCDLQHSKPSNIKSAGFGIYLWWSSRWNSDVIMTSWNQWEYSSQTSEDQRWQSNCVDGRWPPSCDEVLLTKKTHTVHRFNNQPSTRIFLISMIAKDHDDGWVE